MAPSGDGRAGRCAESRVAAGGVHLEISPENKKELQVIKQDLVPLFKLLLGEGLGKSQAQSARLT